MKKLVLIVAVALACAAAFAGGVVGFDFAAATNGAAYEMPLSWTPAFATAHDVEGIVTVLRVHGSWTNQVGTVASNAVNASTSWGTFLRGDKMVLTGTGTVSVEGTR